MFLRALKICDPEYLDGEINNIYAIGKKLCYPSHFLDAAFKKARECFYGVTNRLVFNSVNILCLPFYHDFCHLPRLLKQFNINVIFQYDSSIRRLLISNKPSDNEVGCVYSIPCNRCDKVYLGQTGKTCSKRISQHRYNVRTGNESSGIFIHVRDEDHNINWKETKELYKSGNVTERLIIESCFIDKVPNMNLNSGFYKVDSIMKNMLMKYPGIVRAFSQLKAIV